MDKLLAVLRGAPMHAKCERYADLLGKSALTPDECKELALLREEVLDRPLFTTDGLEVKPISGNDRYHEVFLYGRKIGGIHQPLYWKPELSFMIEYQIEVGPKKRETYKNKIDAAMRMKYLYLGVFQGAGI